MDRIGSDRAMERLNQELALMGSLVEQQLMELGECWQSFRSDCVERILKIEEQINQKHKAIDETCVELIAQFSPKATDLRRVFAINKMNNDLERMGDQCRNCAFILKDLKEELMMDERQTPIGTMLELAKKMVVTALDAFILGDMIKAHTVLDLDDRLDRQKDDTVELMEQKIMQNPGKVKCFLSQIFLAKNIERIGDHATNLAEEIIYFKTGEDVRHLGKVDLNRKS
ncbi:MAG: phosphate signaling complex protein PhoU [Bdellovibrionaceae bacterium]|nr:phosphate signaling complex protein PhoU [Pseudobdellovibrionaceae bacterium]MDW8189593.1 phosphate signaling complex protein PhoU [Pseudobdellovibrionaceae bacterium]